MDKILSFREDFYYNLTNSRFMFAALTTLPDLLVKQLKSSPSQHQGY